MNTTLAVNNLENEKCYDLIAICWSNKYDNDNDNGWIHKKITRVVKKLTSFELNLRLTPSSRQLWIHKNEIVVNLLKS